MPNKDHHSRRTAALQRVARMGGPEGSEAKRMLADEAAASGQKAEANRVAALPKTIAEAKGDARAYSRADIQRQAATGEAAPGSAGASLGRKSMLALLESKGIEPRSA